MYLFVFILLTTSLLAALWLVFNDKNSPSPTKEEQELIDSFYINRK